MIGTNAQHVITHAENKRNSSSVPVSQNIPGCVSPGGVKDPGNQESGVYAG